MNVCRTCGKPTKNKKYCSKSCMFKNPEYCFAMSLALTKNPWFKCKVCGGSTKNPKYCSLKCTWIDRKGTAPALFTKELNERRSDTVRNIWASRSPEEKAKIMEKTFIGLFGRKPRKIETYLDGHIQSNFPNEYIFSGTGKVFIGGKVPDWFNVNGKKQVIELFGDFWHGEKWTGRTKDEEESQRIDHFRKYGYSCLIIWEHEVESDIGKVVERISTWDGLLKPLD
jgi:very-short-patch-repair endonuclease